MRIWWNTIPSVAIFGFALMCGSPAMAHHCEDSKPGTAKVGSFDKGLKYGVHTCAPKSRKLGLSPKSCIPVYDKDGKLYCQ